MFHVLTGLVALYVIGSYVRLLPWQVKVKVLLSVLLVVIAEHHLITRNFFGSMASPEIPLVVLMVLGWAFGAFVLLALLLLLKDSLRLVAYLWSRRKNQVWARAPRLLYGMGLLAMTLSMLGVWEATRVPDTKTVHIRLPNLPAEFDGFSVVQLTDIHASRLLQEPWVKAVVTKANALKPDLMVLTGDIIDGTPEARQHDVQPLRQLHAKHGVYAIPGNHEYYAEYEQWLPVFNDLGLQMLLNKHLRIEQQGQGLIVAGITDAIAPAFGQQAPDIHHALKGVDRTEPIILLSHRPSSATVNAKAGVDLQLSGHTHGGQVLGFHYLVQLANEGFVAGLYAVDAMQLYVSNGTGLWSGFPIRLGRRSEITQIVLHSESA